MSVLDAPAASGTPAYRPAGGTELIPVLVRLKLALLRNGLRQSAYRRAVYIASVVATLLIALGQLIALIALRGHAHAGSLVVLLAAVLAAKLGRDAALLRRSATRPSTRAAS